MPNTKKSMLMSIDREFIITKELVADLMITALESGWSNSWCGSIKLVEPNKKDVKESPWYADPELYAADSKIKLEVEEIEEDGTVYKTHTVTIEEIKDGFDLLVINAPWSFEEIERDMMDAKSAECWWQCVVLGEIIYG